MHDRTTATPPLPDGRIVDLGQRGTLHVRHVEGPRSAPALLLLHGLAATADLNWFGCFEALGESFTIVAPDQRGHGGGIRTRGGFSLEDCADDAAALVEALGLDRVIAVGYSMGGFVAQLLWRRHRERVAGLVLCATATHVSGNNHWPTYQTLAATTTTLRFLPRPFRPNADMITNRLFGPIDDEVLRNWARQEMRRNDLATIFSAMESVVRFSSSSWAGSIDVPTAIIVPEADRVVPLTRQLELAHAIPGASLHRVAGDHGMCLTNPDEFAATLVAACRSVAERVKGSTR